MMKILISKPDTGKSQDDFFPVFYLPENYAELSGKQKTLSENNASFYITLNLNIRIILFLYLFNRLIFSIPSKQ